MNNIFHLILVLVFQQIQWCTSQNIYCQEAVDSVTVVESCPTSKEEWDSAAFKKNCSRIAARQNCINAGEKFQYQFNGLRNKLLEVCAPTRIIFKHCVEFNVRGGVIQYHLSAPCSATFPKCDEYYFSSDAYKYPDCYTLVSKSKKIWKSFTSDESRHIEQWPINTIVTLIIILIIPISTTLFLLLSKDIGHDVRTSNRSMDQHFAKSESSANNIKQRSSNQLNQRFAKSESAAYNKASSQSSTQCFAKSDSSAYRRTQIHQMQYQNAWLTRRRNYRIGVAQTMYICISGMHCSFFKRFIYFITQQSLLSAWRHFWWFYHVFFFFQNIVKFNFNLT